MGGIVTGFRGALGVVETILQGRQSGLFRQLRRELGPDVPLRIDPNCAWSVETSVKVGLALADELSNGGVLEVFRHKVQPCSCSFGFVQQYASDVLVSGESVYFVRQHDVH